MGIDARAVRLGMRLALASALAVLSIYAFWIEPSGLRAVVHPIALPNPAARPLRGLRIAVIADLHAGSAYIDQSKIDSVVRLANGARPDLILIAGDLVAQGTFAVRPIPAAVIAAHLKPLRAPRPPRPPRENPS